MFMTHMDTVPLCAGAKPKQQGRRIVNTAKTALGGDNRTGCAVLATLAAELARQKLDHPPITLLFCVREESGLWGARYVDRDELGAPTMAFNFDGRSAADVVVGAVGADRWEVEIFGRAAHAGGAPERGISATMILAPRARRNQGRRLVRQGCQRKEARHQQCRAGDRRRRPPGRRRHQRGDRLRACARRKPQPRPEVLQADHRRLQGRVRARRDAGQEQRRQGRTDQVQGAHRLSSVPHEGQPARREARGRRDRGGRRRTEHPHRQRRARCELDGSPRHPDGHLRRRPERGAHGR